MRKYGKEQFSIVELESCHTQEQLDEREVFWAKELNTFCPHGYNLRAGKGRGVCSPEVAKKIGDALRGRRFSEIWKQRISQAHQGVPLSPERVADMRERMKGLTPSRNTRMASSLKNAKTYWLTNPEGNTVCIENLKRFCQTHNLHYPKLCEVANRKRESYRGWKVPATKARLATDEIR